MNTHPFRLLCPFVLAPSLALSACDGDPDHEPSANFEDGDEAPLDELAEMILADAVAAQDEADLDQALALYSELERSTDPWFAWAGSSGRVAVHRMMEDSAGALAVTAELRAAQPERAGLMHLWDGDTATLAEDYEAAFAAYRHAAEAYAEELVDGRPLQAIAARQLARVQLLAGDPAGAAATLRDVIARDPGAPEAQFDLATAIVYDEVAAGALPAQPLGVLIHEGECFDGDPCELVSAGASDLAAPSLSLAGIESLRFVLSPADLDLLQRIEDAAAEPRELAPYPAAATCTTPTASSGFVQPLANDHSGYVFMQYPDSTNGFHPGLDINGPGGGDADCGLTFKAASVGCVTDSSPSNWGSATVQSRYSARTWTQQYGHASAIYYSTGAAVGKGASLGKVGKVGAASCHLHFEIREQDHPSPTNADYYNTGSQANVGDWYQDPFPFIAAQRSYVTHKWVDEGSFTFYGSWTPITGVGNEDDMRYALTTASGSKSNYARYAFLPTSTRTYRIYAFVPWNHATSTAASIKLLTSGNTTLVSKTVNQSVLYDSWVYVGSANLSASAVYYLEVASNTGESNRRVGIDDFLLLGI